MTTLNRPPYILIHPGDLHGCGFHRCLRPTEIMSRHGYVSARIEMSFIPEHILPGLDPDVIVFQRQNDDHHYEVMKRYRAQLPNAFFIYEIDDILSAIPDASYHKPFMTPDVDRRVARAASLCDVITVTTQALADHMQALCPDTAVRIVPNMLGKDDLDRVAQVQLKPPVPAPTTNTSRLRVGWGGGMGHAGDLALLQEAFVALRDEVEWVFVGYQPEQLPDGVASTFAGAFPPQHYLQALAATQVDLIVAPLEENQFNECKSNLRLIEAGACNFPVIASPVAPYLTNRPPVYAYAKTAQEWIDQIRKFAALSAQGRKTHAQAMRGWVERRFILDNHLADRVRAWLPETTRIFVPRIKIESRGVAIARTAEELHDLCANSGHDVVYVRPDVNVSDAALEALAAHCADPKVGSCSVMTNDGGPAGFPTANAFAALTPDHAQKITAICREMHDLISVGAAIGPVIVLRRHALEMLGAPDFARWTIPEMAILEWSVASSARGLANVVDTRTFVTVERPIPSGQEDIQRISMRLSARWPVQQADEESLAKYRQDVEMAFFRENYTVALPPIQERTDYTAWIRSNDGMGPRGMQECFEWFTDINPPTVDIVFYGDEPLTFAELTAVESEWKIFMPKDSIPAQVLLPALAAAIDDYPEATIFYGDHDYAERGVRQDHDFKPNFDLHLLLSRDYVSQVLAIKTTELLGTIERPNIYQANAAGQLYTLTLEAALGQRDSVQHVPRVLAHLPKPAPGAQERAAAHTARLAHEVCRYKGVDVGVRHHPDFKKYHEVSYAAPAPGFDPTVLIIIPTKNKTEMLIPCLATLLARTTYSDFKVLVVDNGSDRQEMLDYLLHGSEMQDPRVMLMRWPETYNWSALNNFAVRWSVGWGEYYCFLNDDTRILEPTWLDEMVGAAKCPDVGIVGAKLLYPHGAIQHIGVVNEAGVNGHMHKGMPAHAPGYNGIAQLSHEATAVTGACMLVSAQLFEQFGRLDENLIHNYNDVAFCLEASRRGYVNVVAAKAQVQHFEGVTRTSPLTPEGAAFMQAESRYLAQHYPEPDRYWNRNLMFAAVQNGMLMGGLNMDTFSWPAPPYPWANPQAERILVLGDVKALTNELKDRAIVYRLMLQGNIAQIVEPSMSNVRPFDLRDPDNAVAAIEKLGIDRIIITTLEQGSTLALSFLARLMVPVIYRPLDAESVCPRRNLRPNDSMCDEGWKKGECQGCIDIAGSPNGYVAVEAWRAEWKRFLTRENVTAQLDFMEMPQYGTAFEHAFGAGAVAQV